MYRLVVLLCCLMVACQPAEKAPCTQSKITIQAPQEEVATLKQFITSRKIQATADERGFYYTIDSPGSAPKPTACSNVTVNYTGTLTTGKTFDQADDISFDLGQLIVGWQEGIPLIGTGGKITLYLPPSLAYGAQEQGDIPANSILVFTIELKAIN